MSAAPIEVLVVDDDYRVAGIHAAYVERVQGFTVSGTAHTAEQAFELARTLHPHLVLMDVYLPDGNGLDVVRALLQERESPAVIVISAAKDVATVRQAMQHGAVHYLVKPFGFEALARQLTAFRRLHRHLSALDEHAEQRDVDALFDLRHMPRSTAQPAGQRSALTLDAVRKAVAASDAPVSASDIAATVGVSRATAQRYLTHLERRGVIAVRLRYGAAGRPENRYLPVSR